MPPQPSRSGSRQSTKASRCKSERRPTDILSDGYESDESNGERVVQLLKSGVRARQSEDLTAARDDFARASLLQQKRSRVKRKIDLWLDAIAKKHGKAAGILVHNPALVAKLRELGYTFVALGSDGGSVRAGLASILNTLRGK